MNEYGVAEYDYTLIRLPGEQGWSLRLLKDGQEVSGEVYQSTMKRSVWPPSGCAASHDRQISCPWCGAR